VTGACIETDWTYRNPETVIQENVSLRIAVLPGVVSEMVDFSSIEKSIYSKLAVEDALEVDCVFTDFADKRKVSFLDCVGDVS
jgi:hypothetical protein